MALPHDGDDGGLQELEEQSGKRGSTRQTTAGPTEETASRKLSQEGGKTGSEKEQGRGACRPEWSRDMLGGRESKDGRVKRKRRKRRSAEAKRRENGRADGGKVLGKNRERRCR